jgi:YesN/AraC family two-component response regulator
MINVILVDDETDLFPLFNVKFKREIRNKEIKFNFFTSAKDVLEFIESSSDETFNYILSDINMPDMNGLELLDSIKRYNEKQKVYIISSYKSEDYNVKAKQLGADGFLQKPIDFKILKELIF